jgi:hypothetical protein
MLLLALFCFRATCQICASPQSGPGQSNIKSVTYYQTEFNPDDREVFDRFDAAAAQMAHFAPVLREQDDAPGQVYKIFADRRWGSIPGVVQSMKR